MELEKEKGQEITTNEKKEKNEEKEIGVFLCDLSGKTHSMTVFPYTSVDTLKEMAYRKTKILPEI